ncbi:proline racemase family protein [Haloarcula sp. KBTZ06]|uniref:proline racemase family protein n=1 Tax=unclassified Haloarcula TaxID=2624677 RepID=UPI00059551D4|nr:MULTISPECIES: proline racemase family protein [unclassified Haloarcula]AJF25470.1 proline racemase [Haloarcula sp. CBA1115]KAA9405887.1 proline racemase [Haloarcula sp. CBA1131]
MERTEFITVDTHTGGEPTRIVLDGIEADTLAGETVRERRDRFAATADGVRKLLMQEPRGHADMFGAVPVPTDRADLGVFFMDTDGYLDMCGHGLIGVVTALVERGELPETRELTVETPAGLVDVTVEIADGVVHRVAFENVDSYVCETITVEQDGIPVEARIVYSGNYFAVVDAESLGVTLDGEDATQCIEPALALRRAVNDVAPDDPVTGSSVTVSAVELTAGGDSDRSCVVFADGSIDRSPCGTGTCARLTLHHVDGDLAVGERVEVTGPVGSAFEGYISETNVDDGVTVTSPVVSGTAHITGDHTFYRDDDDTLGSFTLT